MEQRAVDQLRTIARINRSYPDFQMSSSERLERWAEILELNPDRSLSTFRETEYQPDEIRAAMRGDGTAIAVAFSDPVLRAAGMRDDTYGEARRFFELSNRQLHKLVCFCHFGAHVSAGTVAHQVRSIATRRSSGILAYLASFFRR